MVSRVDRKPIVYGAGFVKLFRPVLESTNKELLHTVYQTVKGHAVPKLDPDELVEAFRDVDLDTYWASMNLDSGIWDPTLKEEDEEELIRIARAAHVRYPNFRASVRASDLSNALCKAYETLFSGVTSTYFGAEGAYIYMDYLLHSKIFDPKVESRNWNWSLEAAGNVISAQSPYMFLHAAAAWGIGAYGTAGINTIIKSAWDLYKKTETLALRISSRKSMMAHAHYLGVSKKSFEPSVDVLSDFELPMTGFARGREWVKVYVMNGVRYLKVEDTLIVLTRDDCINICLLSQAYFRALMYFASWNGYDEKASYQADGILLKVYDSIFRAITSGENFAELIRSIHICAQKEFNDIFEAERGDPLGWEARSENYTTEALALHDMGPTLYEEMCKLACSKIDRLNVGMMYHVLIGDDMLISDLVQKVKTMPSKVLDANTDTWNSFIKFSRSYLLARYMFAMKRRPNVKGDLMEMNKNWVSRCLNGNFTMPAVEDYGKVWISEQTAWTNYADTWHLDCQDVAYVMKDAKGMADGKYSKDRKQASELLMAMEHGATLDPLMGSDPHSARERISSGEPTHVAVLTTAPKAENAKPSWKKRVTFAADNEFRKMQAEYDRNARKAMVFMRGPSLGLDQTILESQFKQIAIRTGTTSSGCVCSHDISAWSESMDRDRKFDFEQILIDMTTRPSMTNIRRDWEEIQAVVNKMGAREVVEIKTGSFQGFDGSASTILHSMILLFCIETARRKAIIKTDVRTNLATLIDDCIALMENLTDPAEANNFWEHLKTTYRELGFEVDELKSIFSTIKAIYLSRRFLLGGEVPADLKVYVKAHVSYEDPLRAITDIPKDLFGAFRGACDANGNAWFIYYSAVVSSLMEMSHACPEIMDLPPGAAAVAALAPPDEMGWGFPSIVDWCTNDIMDKRTHFNAIMEQAAEFALAGSKFTGIYDSLTPAGYRMYAAIKDQPWRKVNASGIFVNPFEAVRDGPMKPDLLKRTAVSDVLGDIVEAEPWKSLLAWNSSTITQTIRDLLIDSGPLHAPTLAALVNCMPDNYRISMIGKAVGSSSVLDLLPRGIKILLKRRVHKVGKEYILHMLNIYESRKKPSSAGQIALLSHSDRTRLERDTFYRANGVEMTDHTFPDPVGCFTHVKTSVGSEICPNGEFLHMWDKSDPKVYKVSGLVATRGMYVPKKSARVWEVATEYGKGWDTVSQKIALGMAVLSRAKADGHEIGGLFEYFIRSWNEVSTIELEDANLIAIQGNVKRLDSNPGSSTHPITCHRNFCAGLTVDLKSAVTAIDTVTNQTTGQQSNLHDVHSHYTSMRACTTLIYEAIMVLGGNTEGYKIQVGLRRDCVIPSSSSLMKTDAVRNRILLEIMDSETPYGLVQACPDLATVIVVPTMQVTWVKMINALTEGDYASADEIIRAIRRTDLSEKLKELSAQYATFSVRIAYSADPVRRHTYSARGKELMIAAPPDTTPVEKGDMYTKGVTATTLKSGRIFAEGLASDAVMAVVIKSAIWMKLKEENLEALAAIIYDDPGAKLDIPKALNSDVFWVQVIREGTRHKIKGSLSEVTAKAIYKLGVRGLHIKQSNIAEDIARSIASFFGANLRALVEIVADQICSFVGRRARDYEKPTRELVVAHNPSVKNAKLRREHINALVRYNLKQLKDRLKAIDANKIVHTGDKRACLDAGGRVDREETKARRVFLQVRRMVYKAINVEDNAFVTIEPERLARRIRKAAFTTIIRHAGKDDDDSRMAKKVAFENLADVDYSESAVWEALASKKEPDKLEDVSDYMASLEDLVTCVGGYWNPEMGDAGLRYSAQIILEDARIAQNTTFAISASELAPHVYKSLSVSEIRSRDVDELSITPAPSEAPVDPDAEPIDDEFIYRLMEDVMVPRTGPRWQALATLLYCGYADPDAVNEELGTKIPHYPKASDLRAANLEQFDEDLIDDIFDNIDRHYVMCGMIFSRDWYDADDDDGYLVDEAGTFRIGGFI